MDRNRRERNEPAFSGVFSGTFLSVVLVSLVVAYASRSSPVRRLFTPAVEERPVAPGGGLAPDELANVALFEDASPSVVQIQTESVRFSSRDSRPVKLPESGGSGFVWDAEGHVVTNLHVTRGGDILSVRFKDGTRYQAELVGVAPDYDLAVLRVEAPRQRLVPLPLGRSADLRVGQRSFAIGYPFGLEQTLTTGVISGLDRMIQSQSDLAIHGVIQTDAAINPGNSGGPLLDSSGRLIGVNTAIATGSGSSAGVGFAVPADTVNRIVPRVIAEGSIERAVIGVIVGLDVLAADEGIEGAVVLRVTPGGPADRAGVLECSESSTGDIVLGDVIVGIDEQTIRREADLYQALEHYRPGEEVRIRLSRPSRGGRKTEELSVRLMSLR